MILECKCKIVKILEPKKRVTKKKEFEKPTERRVGRWTEEEERELERLKGENLSISELAVHFNRSYYTMYNKATSYSKEKKDEVEKEKRERLKAIKEMIQSGYTIRETANAFNLSYSYTWNLYHDYNYYLKKKEKLQANAGMRQ